MVRQLNVRGGVKAIKKQWSNGWSKEPMKRFAYLYKFTDGILEVLKFLPEEGSWGGDVQDVKIVRYKCESQQDADNIMARLALMEAI